MSEARRRYEERRQGSIMGPFSPASRGFEPTSQADMEAAVQGARRRMLEGGWLRGALGSFEAEELHEQQAAAFEAGDAEAVDIIGSQLDVVVTDEVAAAVNPLDVTQGEA